MADVHRIATKEALEDAASAWIARLEADDVSDDDRRRFAAWLEEAPRHRETFEAMRHSWHRLDALGEVANGGLAGTVNGRPAVPQPGPGRVGFGWAIAATVLLAIGAGAWWHLRAPAVLVYQTAVGHQLSVSLEDGSTIELNTNTLIEVNFTDTKRIVHLERGEANFAVEKDPTRPFVVLAAGGAVRAVGTRFNVYLTDNSHVEVIVTEGVVEVTKAGESRTESPELAATSAAEEPALVAEGQGIRYDRQLGAVAEIPAPQVERRLAWRQGMLSFDGETLEEVVAQVSRYTNIRFVIDDPGLRELQVGGYFKSADVSAFVNLLDTAFAVEARREGQRIYLTRHPR